MSRAATGIYDVLPPGRPITVTEPDQFNHQMKVVSPEIREPCEADRPTSNKETRMESMATTDMSASPSSVVLSFKMMQEKKKHDDLIALYYKVAICVLAIFLLLALVAIGMLYYAYLQEKHGKSVPPSIPSLVPPSSVPSFSSQN